MYKIIGTDRFSMAKYLHYYETESAFNAAYNIDAGDVTGFTAVLSVGSQDFVFEEESYDHEYYIWSIPGGEYAGVEVWTYTRNPKVGQWSREDGTGAYSPGEEEGIEITQVRTASSDAYHEPWVSYTTDKCVSKFEGVWAYSDYTPFTMEYVGECDWYEAGV